MANVLLVNCSGRLKHGADSIRPNMRVIGKPIVTLPNQECKLKQWALTQMSEANVNAEDFQEIVILVGLGATAFLMARALRGDVRFENCTVRYPKAEGMGWSWPEEQCFNVRTTLLVNCTSRSEHGADGIRPCVKLVGGPVKDLPKVDAELTQCVSDQIWNGKVTLGDFGEILVLVPSKLHALFMSGALSRYSAFRNCKVRFPVSGDNGWVWPDDCEFPVIRFG